MNLSDDQKQAISTLPIGTAVVRLADEYPESFLVKIRKCPIKEGSVSDKSIKGSVTIANNSDSGSNRPDKLSLEGSSGCFSRQIIKEIIIGITNKLKQILIPAHHPPGNQINRETLQSIPNHPVIN